VSEDNKASWLNIEELIHAIARGWKDPDTEAAQRVPAGIARQLAGNIVEDSKAKAEVARKDAKRTCENCRHSDFDEGDYGACRKDPPIGRGATGWPAIRRVDWCGRHEFPRTKMEVIHQPAPFIEFPK
jgi:hypothetical protein